MHGLFKVNMQWNAKSLKNNYSLSFKSMSKTISPFLIILPWLAWWNLWVVQHLYSSLEMWFEFLWRWPFSPIYTWLENIYVYTNLWDCRVSLLMDLECQAPWVLQCISCGSSPDGRNDICCPVLFHNSTEQG